MSRWHRPRIHRPVRELHRHNRPHRLPVRSISRPMRIDSLRAEELFGNRRDGVRRPPRTQAVKSGSAPAAHQAPPGSRWCTQGCPRGAGRRRGWRGSPGKRHLARRRASRGRRSRGSRWLRHRVEEVDDLVADRDSSAGQGRDQPGRDPIFESCAGRAERVFVGVHDRHSGSGGASDDDTVAQPHRTRLGQSNSGDGAWLPRLPHTHDDHSRQRDEAGYRGGSGPAASGHRSGQNGCALVAARARVLALTVSAAASIP